MRLAGTGHVPRGRKGTMLTQRRTSVRLFTVIFISVHDFATTRLSAAVESARRNKYACCIAYADFAHGGRSLARRVENSPMTWTKPPAVGGSTLLEE